MDGVAGGRKEARQEMKRGDVTFWVLAVLRCAVALLFLYAGGIKAFHTQEFAYDVQSYQLTSWTLSILIAVYLPWLELCLGVALFIRRLYLGALVLATMLMLVFLGAITSAWWRKLDITCGCFGPEVNRTNYPLHIATDAAILLLLGILAGVEYRRCATRRGRVDFGRGLASRIEG
jgi:hypothetical protein